MEGSFWIEDRSRIGLRPAPDPPDPKFVSKRRPGRSIAIKQQREANTKSWTSAQRDDRWSPYGSERFTNEEAAHREISKLKEQLSDALKDKFVMHEKFLRAESQKEELQSNYDNAHRQNILVAERLRNEHREEMAMKTAELARALENIKSFQASNNTLKEELRKVKSKQFEKLKLPFTLDDIEISCPICFENWSNNMTAVRHAWFHFTGPIFETDWA